MKAAVYREYGSGKVLSIEEVPIPKIESDEILIKVVATAVNRTDCANLTGTPAIMKLGLGLTKPKRPITGTEFSGIVEKAGNDVSRFKEGDKVFAFSDTILSSFAEYTKMKGSSKNIGYMPEDYSFLDAACSLEGPHYAYNFLNKLPIMSGQKALIHGAGGGIGSAMTQLALHFGLKVTVTCRKDQADLFSFYDLDEIIIYEETDFTQLDHSFDYVLDSVGKSAFKNCSSILKSGGIYMSSELGPGSQNIYYSLATWLFGRVPGSGNRRVKFPYPPNIDQTIELIQQLVSKGKYKPFIDKKYRFENIGEAFDYVLAGQKTGNVILDLQGS